MVEELAAGLAGLAMSAGTVTIKMVTWLKEHRQRVQAKKDLIQGLFGFVADADFTLGTAGATVTPWLRDTLPPYDQKALQLFRSWLLGWLRRGRGDEYLDQIGIVNIDKSLCSVGGPVTHWLTRCAMGYDRKGDAWSTPLPYIYPLRDAELRPARVHRQWGDRHWSAPNWYIAESGTKQPKFTPRVDSGELKSDYLMIIVTPNFLSEKAFYSGQKHLMVAGAHGIAQLAISDVLDNNDILKAVGVGRVGSEFFQAVIAIPEVVRKKGIYEPKGRPFLVDVKPLDRADFKIVDFADWWG